LTTHHFFFARPCPCGTREGNHEHERTVRATIVIVVPFSAFLPVNATLLRSASVAWHRYKNDSWPLGESLLRFGSHTLGRHAKHSLRQRLAVLQTSLVHRPNRARLANLCVLYTRTVHCQQQKCGFLEYFSLVALRVRPLLRGAGASPCAGLRGRTLICAI